MYSRWKLAATMVTTQGVPSETRALSLSLFLSPPTHDFLNLFGRRFHLGENLIRCNSFFVSFSSLNVLVMKPRFKLAGKQRDYTFISRDISGEFSPDVSLRANLLARKKMRDREISPNRTRGNAWKQEHLIH